MHKTNSIYPLQDAQQFDMIQEMVFFVVQYGYLDWEMGMTASLTQGSMVNSSCHYEPQTHPKHPGEQTSEARELVTPQGPCPGTMLGLRIC